MTETSPLLTFSRPPADATAEQDITYRTHRPHRARRAGARRRRARRRAAWDGTSAGEIELRGATITGTYFRVEPRATADTFRDGWLRAGDPGVIHPSGWIELKDRLKDGIKSGGAWISSIELESAVATHPAVAEAVVVCWRPRPALGGTPARVRQAPRRRDGHARRAAGIPCGPRGEMVVAGTLGLRHLHPEDQRGQAGQRNMSAPTTTPASWTSCTPSPPPRHRAADGDRGRDGSANPLPRRVSPGYRSTCIRRTPTGRPGRAHGQAARLDTTER
jgi:acyl-CoA synthetase (AMP-forming)/AMP-acid ligase II